MATASFVSQGSFGIAIENSAIVASRGRGRSGQGTRGILQNGKGGRGRLICSHYRKGHLQNRCYYLIGWPNKTENISSSDTPSNRRTGSQLISDEEYQKLLRHKSNNHTQPSAPSSVSTACISQSMESQGPWIINSGAPDHISSNEPVFSSISSPKFSHFISLANGSKMLIGKGHESRGLYYLSNNPSTLCFAYVSPKFLHNRLGHPSLAKLKLMVLSLNKLSTLECESCQLGKHVKSTFPNQVNKRCNSPFSIVHSDIWGPSRVTSFGFN
ncbi:hypothetical protein CR513_08167, partial [Mucuna pruriens]